MRTEFSIFSYDPELPLEQAVNQALESQSGKVLRWAIVEIGRIEAVFLKP